MLKQCYLHSSYAYIIYRSIKVYETTQGSPKLRSHFIRLGTKSVTIIAKSTSVQFMYNVH